MSTAQSFAPHAPTPLELAWTTDEQRIRTMVEIETEGSRCPPCPDQRTVTLSLASVLHLMALAESRARELVSLQARGAIPHASFLADSRLNADALRALTCVAKVRA